MKIHHLSIWGSRYGEIDVLSLFDEITYLDQTKVFLRRKPPLHCSHLNSILIYDLISNKTEVYWPPPQIVHKLYVSESGFSFLIFFHARMPQQCTIKTVRVEGLTVIVFLLWFTSKVTNMFLRISLKFSIFS